MSDTWVITVIMGGAPLSGSALSPTLWFKAYPVPIESIIRPGSVWLTVRLTVRLAGRGLQRGVAWSRLGGMAPEVLLAAVSLIHVGFQTVVTVVVYPALVASPVEAWSPTHNAHSHRMALLVAPLYLALLAACLLVLIGGPWTVGTGLALAGNGAAGLTTALVAGPTHGRLSSGRTDLLVARLMAADRVRFAGALVAGVGGLIVLAQR